MIDWRELHVFCSVEDAVKIAHEVAKESTGTIEINYVEYKDYGDYSAEHNDPYEAEIWASDYEFHGKGHGDSISTALMRAVIEFLKDKEFKPARSKEVMEAIDKIPPLEIKAILKGEVEKRTAKYGQYSKFDLIKEIRKTAGLPDDDTR